MGQYHLTVNLSQKEFIDPHRLGDGLKLWEQGASQGGVLNALHALLAVSNGRGGGDYITGHEDFVGRWGGDAIAVVGDYTESGDLRALDYGEFIYAACRSSQRGGEESYTQEELGPFKAGEWTDVSDLARSFLAEQWQLEFGDDGWVSRTPLPDSVFGPRTEAAMRPDMLIDLSPPAED